MKTSLTPLTSPGSLTPPTAGPPARSVFLSWPCWRLRHVGPFRRIAALLALGGAALLAAPGAMAQGTTNSTITVSTSSSEVLHDSTATQRIDTYVTEIIGRVNGGATLFDQTYAFAFGSSQVTAGVAGAQAALASFFGVNPFSLTGPTLLSSVQTLFSSVIGAPVVTSTLKTESITLEDSIGPNTILIGNLDLGGTPFLVLAGKTNVNIITHTLFDIFRTITTTNTFNTVARYEVVGTSGAPTNVPEPGTWALALLGLGFMGWQARRRSRRNRS